MTTTPGNASSNLPGKPPVVDLTTWQAAREELLVREKAHTREGDAIAAARRRLPMVELDGAVEVTGVDGPVPFVELFQGRDELVATLKEVDEWDRPVCAGDLDRAVDLDHRQPPPGRRDRVALAGVRLFADQQLVAGRLPRSQVDDGRLAGEVATRVAGPGRHGVLRCLVSCARGLPEEPVN